MCARCCGCLACWRVAAARFLFVAAAIGVVVFVDVPAAAAIHRYAAVPSAVSAVPCA